MICPSCGTVVEEASLVQKQRVTTFLVRLSELDRDGARAKGEELERIKKYRQWMWESLSQEDLLLGRQLLNEELDHRIKQRRQKFLKANVSGRK